MSLEEGKVRIEKFDGSDFGFWKMQIEDYLYQKKLYLPLIGQNGVAKMGFVRSADTQCDPVDISQKCCVQHHEREHNRRFDEGVVKYV